jgi:N6-adenosine-specific RNA methylase IME4
MLDDRAPAPFEALRRNYYAVITADPPLAFSTYTSIQSANPQSNRDLRRHYRCPSLDEILALPVADLAAKDGCHLFIWTSPPNIERSLAIMRAWGFKFSTKAFTWVKLRRGFDMQQLRIVPLMESDLHTGLGLTTRKGTEDVFLGRRGNCKPLAKASTKSSSLRCASTRASRTNFSTALSVTATVRSSNCSRESSDRAGIVTATK